MYGQKRLSFCLMYQQVVVRTLSNLVDLSYVGPDTYGCPAVLGARPANIRYNAVHCFCRVASVFEVRLVND